MGISLGNSSKKPYVGSKEVQEAYVGSQLVYQNEVAPTGNIIFDGSVSSLLNPAVTNPGGGKFDIAAIVEGKAPNAVLRLQSGNSYDHLCGIRFPTPGNMIYINVAETTTKIGVYVYDSAGTEVEYVGSINYLAGRDSPVSCRKGGSVVVSTQPRADVKIKKISIRL